MGRQEVPPVGRRAAAHRAGARPVLHCDGVLRARQRIYGTLPFLVLFQVGFLYTGLLSIVQQYAGDSDRCVDSRGSRLGSTGLSEVEGRGPPGHSRHHPLRHRSARRARRRLRRARARARRRSSRTTSPGTSRFPRRTRRRGSSRARSRRSRGAASPIRSASRTRRSSPTPSRARTSTTTSRSSSSYDDPRPLQLQGRGHDVGALPAEGADARARPHLPGGHPASPTTSSARTSSTCRRRSATSTRRRPAR